MPLQLGKSNSLDSVNVLPKTPRHMKSDRLIKILLIGFSIALAVYIGFFSLIEYRRTYRGPWQVQFSTDSTGTPALLVTHRKLNISKSIRFPENKVASSNTTQTIVFDNPTNVTIPYGDLVFEDLTFLPGTVTFNFFGHEVELLPRVLLADKLEYAWNSPEIVSIAGEGKFVPHKTKPKRL